MTFSIDGNDFMQVIEIASIVGTVVAAVLIGLVIYLMVRPSRRDAAQRPHQPEALDAEEVIALIERMESRLAVLERAIGDDSERERLAPPADGNFEAAEGGRDLGRMK
jgi:hypothetical protein